MSKSKDSITKSELTQADYYVATNGSDAWSGRLAEPNRDKTDGPFATLGHVRDEIRKLKKAGGLPTGPIAVEVRGGVYELKAPFELTAEDSGVAQAAIVYRAKKGEEVRLVGGKILAGWQPVTDPATLDRLDPTARGKVFQTDLRAQGVTDFGQLQPAGMGSARAPVVELFFADQPMVLARWPNEGFVQIASVVGGDSRRADRDAAKTTSGQITVEGDRWRRWLGEKELWLHGYWLWDWADQRQKVTDIVADSGVISLAKPYHKYGYRAGARVFAFNALSEIDTPGEWYLDRGAGVLYFWPPAPIETSNPMLSILPSLVTMKDASFVTLRRMTLEVARGTAVEITGGAHCRVEGCTIRNVGNWAVWINSGTDHGVAGCDIYQTGDGGIMLDGGDRKTLTPAGHFAENNHIHHYSRINRMYNPAVSIQGVGNRATHNLMDHAPHCAIMFGGNDHLIEFNEMHNVCYEATDAGAIYAGRSWTMRGNVIRYNYLHHIQGLATAPGTFGIYLDDLFAGVMVFGNVFYRVPQAVIFSGRDNTFENNVFVECEPAIWGFLWSCLAQLDNNSELVQGLAAVPYKDALWSSRYPLLPNILEDGPYIPKRSAIVHNVCSGSSSLLLITQEEGRSYLRIAENFEGEDPHFVDAKHGNFQLRDDSPAYKLGFQRIPIEKIGLYKDGLRAAWPVKHAVQGIRPHMKIAIDPVIGADDINHGKITIGNLCETAFKGQIKIEAPPELRISMMAKVSIPPGKSLTLPFKVQAVQPFDGDRRVRFLLLRDGVILASHENMFLRKKNITQILQPKRTIRLNGDLQDWEGIPGEKVDTIAHETLCMATDKKQGWQGPADLSFTTRWAWDKNAIYLRIDVTDDKLTPAPEHRQDVQFAWQYDCAEIFLGAIGAQIDDLSKATVQLVVVPSTTDQISECKTMILDHGLQVDARFYGKKTGQGYIMEGRITPKSENQIRLKPDQIIALEVVIDDTDDPDIHGGGPKTRMALNSKRGSHPNDPLNWRLACLA